jgi:hypothetical protein
MQEITPETFILFAIKNYDNPGCTGLSEFYDDLKRFKYVKKLFKRYKVTGDLKERLIINHLVVINNIFGQPAACKLLLHKIEADYRNELNSFLLYLNMIDESLDENSYDKDILEKLRRL